MLKRYKKTIITAKCLVLIGIAISIYNRPKSEVLDSLIHISDSTWVELEKVYVNEGKIELTMVENEDPYALIQEWSSYSVNKIKDFPKKYLQEGNVE